MYHVTARCLIRDRLQLGEGPLYDPRTGILSLTDILNGTVYFLDAEKLENAAEPIPVKAAAEDSVTLQEMVGAAVPCTEPGRYILAATKALYTYREHTVTALLDTAPYYESCQRTNDAKSDPAGRLFFGSHVFTEQPKHGNLFCYDGDTVRISVPDTGIANGMAWSSDEKTFYFADSPLQTVFRYDYDKVTGGISGRTALCRMENGIPDGLCIDENDDLWIAVWGGHRVEQRSGKTGELLSVIEVNAEQVSSCCFFGKNNDLLFITSSADGMTGPEDGCCFVCRLPVKGGKMYCCR